jgi:hypothetical protein
MYFVVVVVLVLVVVVDDDDDDDFVPDVKSTPFYFMLTLFCF